MNRSWALVALGALGVLAGTCIEACASEGDGASPPSGAETDADAESDGDRGPPRDASAEADTGLGSPACSDDGWCLVAIPEIEAISISAIWGSSAQDVWAVGSAGAILHFDGAGWTALPKGDGGTKQTLFTVWGSGPNDVWAGSTERVLLHSDGWKQGSATWSVVSGSSAWQRRLEQLEQSDPPGKFRVWNLWGTGPDDIWMLPSDSIRAWHADGYRGGQVDWTPVLDYFPGSSIAFKGIWGASARDLWIVGSEGKILCAHGGYQDGLVDWQIANSGTREDLDAVWGTAADDVWAIGRGGVIRHFTYDRSGTLGWLPSDSKVDVELRALWGSGPSDLWAVGDDGTVLHGDGERWATSKIPALPSAPALRGVWGSSDKDVWVVGDGVLLHRGPGQVR